MEISQNVVAFSEYMNFSREKRGTQLINAPAYDVKKKSVINSDLLKNFRVMLHKKIKMEKKILHSNKPKSFHHIIQLLMHDNSYMEF